MWDHIQQQTMLKSGAEVLGLLVHTALPAPLIPGFIEMIHQTARLARGVILFLTYQVARAAEYILEGQLYRTYEVVLGQNTPPEVA